MRRSWEAEIKATQGAATSVEVLSGLSFHDQSRRYFKRYQGSDLRSLAMNKFVSAVNSTLKDLHALPAENVTSAIVEDLFTGHKGPTASQVHALAQVFTGAGIDFYRDEREPFVELGLKAAETEIARVAAAATRVTPLRATNPKEAADKPSFIEMLEESHHRNESFQTFIFSRVLPTWGLSSKNFSDHLESLPKKEGVKKTISETAILLWNSRTSKPNEESVMALASAFGMDAKEGEMMSATEKKLWRVAHGHRFTWPAEKGPALEGKEALDAAIAQAAKDGHGKLLDELQDASGILEVRIKALLGTGAFTAWRKDTHIPNVALASKLVGLLSEAFEGSPEEIQKQKLTLLSLLTGREFNVDKILEKTRKAGNPGGDMLMSLTGRYGMVTVEKTELAAALCVPESRIRKMRVSTTLIHAGHITEAVAEATMKLMEKKLEPLIADGVCIAFTDEQKEQCVDVMTGHEHPRTMLKKCAKGEMEFRDMLKGTMQRKDLHQESGPGNFAEQIGVSSLTLLLTGKRDGNHQTAQKIADWYKKNYGFKPRECYKVRALAVGIDISKTPDMLLDEALQCKRPRLDVLTDLYDHTGLTRPNMAEEAKVPYRIIERSLIAENDGRLFCDNETALKLAAGLGISTARREEFAMAFTSAKIEKPVEGEAPTAKRTVARRS